MVSETPCPLPSIAAMIPGRRRFRSSHLRTHPQRQDWNGDLAQEPDVSSARLCARRGRVGLARSRKLATNCSKPKWAESLRSGRSVADSPADRRKFLEINDFSPDFNFRILRLEGRMETGLSVQGILFRACSFID